MDFKVGVFIYEAAAHCRSRSGMPKRKVGSRIVAGSRQGLFQLVFAVACQTEGKGLPYLILPGAGFFQYNKIGVTNPNRGMVLRRKKM